MRDLAVVGAGPAGLMLAAEAAARGISVVVVDPAPEHRWPNNYGVWVDALAALGLEACLAARWPTARVHFGDDQSHAIPRAYGRVDNDALKQAILRRAGPGLERVPSRVVGVTHDADHSTLALASGGAVEARVVVDATGPASALLEPTSGGVPAAQVAFGQILRVDRLPIPQHELLLMDYRPLPGHGPTGADEPASFLYAMPLGPDLVFVEETVLVSRPPLSLPILQDRLQRRLSSLGLLRYDVEAEERCYIPMGAPPPRGPQRVVPFGAAAGMVHPATGYQLDRALALAPALAEVLAAGLEAGASPGAVAASGWEAVWPRARRRLWAVYGFGMEVLLDLDGAGLRAFFHTFFSLEAEVWGRYLGGTATGAQVATAMLKVFTAAPGPIRRRLLAHGLGPGGWSLLRGLGD